MLRVSVVVPTYNRRECIIETLDSVLNQTARQFEVLVVDDGSADESAVEVLRRYGPDPKRAESLWRQHTATATGAIGFGFWTQGIPLQYIYQPNRGMGATRNRGLQASQGELIAFLEPDFRWDLDYLERQIAYLDLHPDAWVVHGKVAVGRASARGAGRRGRGETLMQFEEVVSSDPLHASALVVRRKCLELHGGFDENLPACEDYDLWVRIAAHVPIHIAPESVVHTKRTSTHSSWSLDRYRVYALEKAYQCGHLNHDQRHRVAVDMVARCDTLVDGYRKRNNTERANFYDRKRKKFEGEVQKLDMSEVAARTCASGPKMERAVEDPVPSSLRG